MLYKTFPIVLLLFFVSSNLRAMVCEATGDIVKPTIPVVPPYINPNAERGLANFMAHLISDSLNYRNEFTGVKETKPPEISRDGRVLSKGVSYVVSGSFNSRPVHITVQILPIRSDQFGIEGCRVSLQTNSSTVLSVDLLEPEIGWFVKNLSDLVGNRTPNFDFGYNRGGRVAVVLEGKSRSGSQPILSEQLTKLVTLAIKSFTEKPENVLRPRAFRRISLDENQSAAIANLFEAENIEGTTTKEAGRFWGHPWSTLLLGTYDTGVIRLDCKVPVWQNESAKRQMKGQWSIPKDPEFEFHLKHEFGRNEESRIVEVIKQLSTHAQKFMQVHGSEQVTIRFNDVNQSYSALLKVLKEAGYKNIKRVALAEGYDCTLTVKPEK